MGLYKWDSPIGLSRTECLKLNLVQVKFSKSKLGVYLFALWIILGPDLTESCYINLSSLIYS